MRAREYICGTCLSLSIALAQTPRPLQFNVVYNCGNGQSRFRVLSCTGGEPTDSCEAQYVDPMAPQGAGAKITAPRKSLVDLAQTCVVERPPARPAAAPPAAAPVSQPPAPA